VTLWLLDPLTAALSWTDFPADTDAVAGVTEMATAGVAVSEIVALAVFVESAALAAVTVTVCAEAMVDGAV
jgi:hypothetical protein